MKTHFAPIGSVLVVFACSISIFSQASSGTIFGTVTDQNNAVVPGATVAVKNPSTGFTRSATTDESGRYRFTNLPTGQYEVSVEASGFKKYQRNTVTLDIGQEATVPVSLEVGDISAEVVTSRENASVLNTTTAEVSTSFDSRRISELPIGSNRSAYNILLSVAGVSPRVTGQTAFALGISYVANGGRIRSNSFLLDGQDLNDPALGGSQMALNNPDAIREVRIVTSQFLPEHGHNAGSVVYLETHFGTNNFHGSAFWFHNNENLNACSNTDKAAGFCNPNATNGSKQGAPYRQENQVGFTIGGPVFFPRFGENVRSLYNGTDRTHFFGDYQRWTDRRTPSITIRGAPTPHGRASLQTVADRPQVEQLLRFVPVGIPNGRRSPTVYLSNGTFFDVEIGDATSSADFRYNSDQGSFRVDHSPDENNRIFARYRAHYESTRRAAQIAPPGHGTKVDLSVHAAVVGWTTTVSPTMTNEALAAWKRLDLDRDAEDLQSYSIPAIEIIELGMVGVPETETRTAFGLATNLPVFRRSDGFQLADSVSVIKGSHEFKFGGEFRHTAEKSALFSLGRGSLVYTTLDNFVNDRAQLGLKGFPVAGSDTTQFYQWNEAYFYAQDKWKVRPDLTLLYGVRYEYPGDSFEYLRAVNQRILVANNNDSDYRFEPYPKPDMNNWMPRVGINWNPRTSGKGVVGFVTGGDKLVVRLGYARAYDPLMININQNIFTAFPFTATQAYTGMNASYWNVVNATSPGPSRMLARIVVPRYFRSPAMDQISFDVQRELREDLLLRIGYVRTRGTGLFQAVQGNPRVPCPFGTGQPPPNNCNTTLVDRNTGEPIVPPRPFLAPRVDPTRDVVTIRGNSGSSTYDGLQASLEKRLSRGLSFGLHYTWSALIDTGSDFFSPAVAEGGLSQDPFNWAADRARGSYDRPHRLSGNIVYELPFFTKQRGIVGKILGGWQVNSFFNFQTGAPFSPLNGLDPAGVGGTMRPNLFVNLDVSRMSVAELYLIDRQLRAQADARALQIFNAIAGTTCEARWLPGPPLPVTLFTAPRGRVVCTARGRELVMEYNGIPEGQRVGNTGRNILRADGLRLVDIGIVKNTQLTQNVRVQFWTDFLNAFNERNFGIPPGVASGVDFLDQWATDGGSRRIRLGARVVF